MGMAPVFCCDREGESEQAVVTYVEDLWDLVVVGGGPAGIAAAAEAKLAGLERTVVFEKGPEHNHMIAKLYTPGKRVDLEWKGVDEPAEGALYIRPGNRETYLQTMADYIERFGVDLRVDAEVWNIERDEEGFFITHVAPDESYRSRAVIIAIGVMGRPNKPDYRIPARCKPHVHYDLTSKEIRDSRVLVVGGGDSASEAVQYLVEQGNRVVLSYRRDNFERMNDLNRDLLFELAKKGRADVWNPTNIEALSAGEGGGVVVHFTERDAEAFDEIVYCLGGASPAVFLRQIGLEFDGAYPDVDPETCETEIPGLFLSGDVALKGRGSITTALNTAHRIIANGLPKLGFELKPIPLEEVRASLQPVGLPPEQMPER